MNFDYKIIFKDKNDLEKIALKTFHPMWFIKYCFKLFGRSEALRFLESNCFPPPTYVRINTLKAPEERILREMELENIIVRETEVEYVYRVIKTEKPLVRTKCYEKGFFQIQDKASCIASLVANPKPNEIILDVCAAPGAKTTHLAQIMGNKGVIVSIDYSVRRMSVWCSTISRMGVEIAYPVIADARRTLPINLRDADLVILDPPCTSTGAFWKMPSAKWRLNKRSPIHMAEIQWKMLESSAKYMKPGGYLVYSTCSITVEENEMLIERFLRLHPEFKLVKPEIKIGLPGLRNLSKCIRLYPHRHECNGYFIAKLVKED